MSAVEKAKPREIRALLPAKNSKLSRGPFVCLDDGTILDADGRVFCVLGHPDDPLAEQDITNGAALLGLHNLRTAAAELASVASGAVAYLPQPRRDKLSAAVETCVKAFLNAGGPR